MLRRMYKSTQSPVQCCSREHITQLIPVGWNNNQHFLYSDIQPNAVIMLQQLALFFHTR